MKRLAIIGSGITGLSLARFIHKTHEVTLFESDSRLGGHAHTVNVNGPRAPVSVDTGFMVFNEVTYPHLTRLFRELGVPTTPTDMSFSVQAVSQNIEYAGSSLNHLFAQRSNLLRPSFYRFLSAINRFNHDAARLVQEESASRVLGRLTLEEFVRKGDYGEDFLTLYLLPMSSAVWSTPPEKMLGFPAFSLLSFFHNHGFLGLHTQHTWLTVTGGSRNYVTRLAAPILQRVRASTPVRSVHREGPAWRVSWENSSELFDLVAFACHPPTTLDLLGSEAGTETRRLLSCFKYQPNPTSLHKDPGVLPRRPLARSSWNYRMDPRGVSTHYWMNRLQKLDTDDALIVTLNGGHLVKPARILREFAYEHPLFDLAAWRAQAELDTLNQAGVEGSGLLYAGAWQGHGFHEDGLASSVRLATRLLKGDPWSQL